MIHPGGDYVLLTPDNARESTTMKIGHVLRSSRAVVDGAKSLRKNGTPPVKEGLKDAWEEHKGNIFLEVFRKGLDWLRTVG